MNKIIDMTGLKFGRLTVITRGITPPTSNKAHWLCICECGNIKVIDGRSLRRGVTKSCGCINSPNLTGMRFGKLLVICRAGSTKDKRALWLCKCDCGNNKIATGICLRNGDTKSCGCLKLIANKQNAQKRRLNLIDNRYGKLTVIDFAEQIEGESYFYCKCDCGNYKTVKGTYLKSGDVKSCGCLNSYAEIIIEYLLKENSINFTSQYSFPNLISPNSGHRLRFDFAIFNSDSTIKNLVEYQGEYHFKQVSGWEDINNVQLRDEMKVKYCEENHIPLIILQPGSWKTLTIKDLLYDE